MLLQAGRTGVAIGEEGEKKEEESMVTVLGYTE